jgi:pimeloyl-ACP methyl ester carboxylesterase
MRKPEQVLAFLPAMEPGNRTYGQIPERIALFPGIAVRQVNYPKLVWYNRAVQDEAIAQIRGWNVRSIILVGFSKSGLGAWNIARRIPDLVAGTIIFDSPVARDTLPPWGTAPFYKDDAAWQEDLPLRTCEHFKAAMQADHRLVLISGAGFHDEMSVLSAHLSSMALQHVFLPRPDMKHHWNAGWIEDGVGKIVEKECARKKE